MGYWPSYSNIAPGCRAAYLQWLADGCHAADAYIGYVFLYFYGPERRLLVDAEKSAAAQREHDVLVTEVRRLLAIYGTAQGRRPGGHRLGGTGLTVRVLVVNAGSSSLRTPGDRGAPDDPHACR
jgi:hypothetical protein